MQPDATQTETPTTIRVQNNVAFQEYLTWRAIGGMIVSETGSISPLTLDGFCKEFGVDRTTVWRWSRKPGIANMIKGRLEEIAPLTRTITAWNRLFLIGMSSLPTGKDDKGRPKGALHGDQRAAVDALSKYLGHFGEMRLPVQRQDVKVTGGFLDMMTAAHQAGVIEGEIIDATNHELGPGTDAGRKGQDTSALPPTP